MATPPWGPGSRHRVRVDGDFVILEPLDGPRAPDPGKPRCGNPGISAPREGARRSSSSRHMGVAPRGSSGHRNRAPGGSTWFRPERSCGPGDHLPFHMVTVPGYTPPQEPYGSGDSFSARPGMAAS